MKSCSINMKAGVVSMHEVVFELGITGHFALKLPLVYFIAESSSKSAIT